MSIFVELGVVKLLVKKLDGENLFKMYKVMLFIIFLSSYDYYNKYFFFFYDSFLINALKMHLMYNRCIKIGRFRFWKYVLNLIVSPNEWMYVKTVWTQSDSVVNGDATRPTTNTRLCWELHLNWPLQYLIIFSSRKQRICWALLGVLVFSSAPLFFFFL